MAGDWIKMRVDLDDDPAVIGISSKTGLDTLGVVGRLHRLWSWADRQSRDGHADGVTEKWIDRYVDCDGFASAMSAHRWLSITEHGVSFPSFDRHNGKTAKSRALSTVRQRNARVTEMSRTKRDKSVTREEKRRESTPLPPWLPENEFAAFEESRKRLRRPMTDRARSLVITELEKLRGSGHDPAAVLSQSVRKGWLDVFPIKDAQPAGGNPLYRREGVM